MAYKVLIADDDRNLLNALTIRLLAAGYDVVGVQDAYQAVEQARKSWPDVLVLDVNMPAGDGFSVQDRVDRMAHLKGIPVIYLTGERSVRVRELFSSQHAAALIFKPFETADLLAAIHDAIDPSRLEPSA